MQATSKLSKKQNQKPDVISLSFTLARNPLFWLEMMNSISSKGFQMLILTLFELIFPFKCSVYLGTYVCTG